MPAVIRAVVLLKLSIPARELILLLVEGKMDKGTKSSASIVEGQSMGRQQTTRLTTAASVYTYVRSHLLTAPSCTTLPRSEQMSKIGNGSGQRGVAVTLLPEKNNSLSIYFDCHCFI